ncbi:Actin-related protein 2/3 complex subunit 2 [Thelohanellus kitauei]|uniref:Arp2/3 complex 34 kDa subunit n=1 Tax=Thelohanellus kitauei TaxID=669202 RepID=A0A0C2M352_THEKT|nr:Actin-related protein 2/3 complex subunit 2 [Thelohanellus kitauei]
MILLDVENQAILSVLRKKSVLLDSGKPDSVDSHFTDLDGIKYHIISNPDDKTKIFVNIEIPFKFGIDVSKYLAGVYQDAWAGPQPKADFRIIHDISLPDDKKESSCMRIAQFRLHLYSAFLNYFQGKMGSGETRCIRIKDDECITFQAASDRITVTYSVVFKDQNGIIGRVFLQEFKEGKRSSKNAPAVSVYLNTPPSDLESMKLPTGSEAGHISFTLTNSHLNPTNFSKTAGCVQNFLPYFKYHINCSKGYLHFRMRQKTEDLTKILNRAKLESSGSSSTQKGKTRPNFKS